MSLWCDYCETSQHSSGYHVIDLQKRFDKAEQRANKLADALRDIIKRGKGNGGAVVVTTETLRGIARAALENDK